MKGSAGNGNRTRFMMDARHCVPRAEVLLRSPKGYFGLGLEAMEEGDPVLHSVSVQGCLSPSRRVGHQYVLVGESYIYGAMKGEVIDTWRKGDLEVETFEIR